MSKQTFGTADGFGKIDARGRVQAALLTFSIWMVHWATRGAGSPSLPWITTPLGSDREHSTVSIGTLKRRGLTVEQAVVTAKRNIP